MFIDPGQPLRHIHVSIEIDIAVGRMIIAAVEIQVIVISEVGNVDRVAAGLMPVRRVRIQDCIDLAA